MDYKLKAGKANVQDKYIYFYKWILPPKHSSINDVTNNNNKKL